MQFRNPAQVDEALQRTYFRERVTVLTSEMSRTDKRAAPVANVRVAESLTNVLTLDKRKAARSRFSLVSPGLRSWGWDVWRGQRGYRNRGNCRCG